MGRHKWGFQYGSDSYMVGMLEAGRSGIEDFYKEYWEV